jgi:hypothetical protein
MGREALAESMMPWHVRVGSHSQPEGAGFVHSYCSSHHLYAPDGQPRGFGSFSRLGTIRTRHHRSRLEGPLPNQRSRTPAFCPSLVRLGGPVPVLAPGDLAVFEISAPELACLGSNTSFTKLCDCESYCIKWGWY